MTSKTKLLTAFLMVLLSRVNVPGAGCHEFPKEIVKLKPWLSSVFQRPDQWVLTVVLMSWPSLQDPLAGRELALSFTERP